MRFLLDSFQSNPRMSMKDVLMNCCISEVFHIQEDENVHDFSLRHLFSFFPQAKPRCCNKKASGQRYNPHSKVEDWSRHHR